MFNISVKYKLKTYAIVHKNAKHWPKNTIMQQRVTVVMMMMCCDIAPVRDVPSPN